MHAGFFLVLLLSTTIISQSEGKWGWFHRATKWVKKVLSHVKGGSCTYNFGAGNKLSCKLGPRQKRDASEDLDQNDLDMGDLCDDNASELTENGIPYSLIMRTLEQLDSNNKLRDDDDIMQAEEFKKFMSAMSVYGFCNFNESD